MNPRTTLLGLLALVFCLSAVANPPQPVTKINRANAADGQTSVVFDAPLVFTDPADYTQLLNDILATMTYKGTWDASTDTPTIPPAAPANNRWYYIVSVAGTTLIDGTSSWAVGDWITSNGAAWVKTHTAGISPEPYLGNPPVDGYVLSSTAAGLRSWVVPPTGTGGGGSGDMLLAGVQTVTGAKTFNASKLLLAGSTSGTMTLNAPAAAGGVITLPSGTDTLVGRNTVDTLTNKTFPTLTFTTGNGTTLNAGEVVINGGVIDLQPGGGAFFGSGQANIAADGSGYFAGGNAQIAVDGSLIATTYSNLQIQAEAGAIFAVSGGKLFGVSNTLSFSGTDSTAFNFPAASGNVVTDNSTSVLTNKTYNKVTITQPATGATLTIANGKTFTANNSIALFGTDSTTFGFPAGSDTVATLAATQVLTNKTYNRVTITPPVTGATLTIANNKTLTANNTITLTGTDGKTFTVNNTLTLAGTDGSTLNIGAGGTLGTAAFMAGPASAIVGISDTQTLTNKRITYRSDFQAPTVAGSTVTPNSDTTDVLDISPSANFILGNPSGTPTNMQVLVVTVVPSGANRAMTFDSNYDIPTSSALTNPVTITAGKMEIFAFRYSLQNSKWNVVSAVPGY